VLIIHSWDARSPDPAGVFIDRRTHSAGVTAIEVDPHNCLQVATGAAMVVLLFLALL